MQGGDGARWDRRANTRFALNLGVRYVILDQPGTVATGSGRTIDLSSSGLRFEAKSSLQPGLKLEVAIDWPVQLEGGVHLQLIARGVIVWTRGTETALLIQRHELRTRRAELKVAGPREFFG